MELTLDCKEAIIWKTIKLYRPPWGDKLYASARSFDVDAAITLKRTLIIIYDTNWMIIPWEALCLHLANKPCIFAPYSTNNSFTEPQPPYRNYYLVDFPWTSNSIYVPLIKQGGNTVDTPKAQPQTHSV